MYVPDNLDMFNSYESAKEAALQRLPECSICGCKIQDECCYQINDEIICESCMKDFLVYTDDLMN